MSNEIEFDETGRVKVTVENLSSLLQRIGCECHHDPQGYGWHRTFIQVRSKDPKEPPLSLGRAMFRNGDYQYVKWYLEPERNLDDRHIYFYRWWTLLELGKPIDDEAWRMLKIRSQERAMVKYMKKVEAREALPTEKPNGEPYKRPRLSPPNQRDAAHMILGEIFAKHGRAMTDMHEPLHYID